jgi:hypothetical protein
MIGFRVLKILAAVGIFSCAACAFESMRFTHTNYRGFCCSTSTALHGTEDRMSRRIFTENMFVIVPATAFLTAPISPAEAAVLQSGACASGEGDGCDNLSEGNEFIKNLQMKSAEKREQYAQVRKELHILLIA